MADRAGIREALAGILKAVSESPQLLTDKVKQALSGLLQRVKGVVGGEVPVPPIEPPIEPPVPPISPPQPPAPPQPPPLPTLSDDVRETATLLWQMSGGNPTVFYQYLESFPDLELKRVLDNPGLFQQMVTEATSMGVSPPGESDGIQGSQIRSSNVFGTSYDPQQQKLLVKFNGKNTREGGPLYEYDGVSPQMAGVIENGLIPAKTNGRNKFGSWWQGKTPSLGASVNEMLKNSGIPYRKVSN